MKKIELFTDVITVLMGYSKREKGVIDRTLVNKLLTGLGRDKVSKEDLNFCINDINESDYLAKLYTSAMNGDVTIDDISPIGGEEPVTEENVFSMVTPHIMEQQKKTEFLREYKKVQREGTALKILMDEVKKTVVEELKGLPSPKYIERTDVEVHEDNSKALIVAFSDWHVGLETFGSRTGDFNFKRLQKSVSDTVGWAKDQITERNFEEVHVVFLGDVIENQVMRNTQSFDLEFHMAAQISKSIRLFIDMLQELSTDVPVTFSMVTGNHSRFFQNKNDNLANNNVEYIILDTLFTVQESLGQLPNVTLTDNRGKNDIFDIEVAGHRVVGVHGDKMPKAKEKIPAFMKDGQTITLLLSGHLHFFNVVQESFGRMHVQISSPVGENDFSSSLQLPATMPSQQAIVLYRGKQTREIVSLMFGENGELA
ncbi:DNA polymerase 1 [Bacillus phage SalinJah]|uniref:DNA polymerase 1 n=1 Tax=Bacillus phage SalinJah TaxID=1837830 RepID=A0A173GBI9_9CAUD|nr:exonuclease [Bacillus phage SalinJah]ANH50741.1 DNA polymerase 1 [Bacillus phage SalinJah]